MGDSGEGNFGYQSIIYTGTHASTNSKAVIVTIIISITDDIGNLIIIMTIAITIIIIVFI